MELREYLQAVRRRWRLVLAMVVLAVGVSAALTVTVTPAYRSSTTLFIAAPADNGPDAGPNRVNSYLTLLTGPRIASAVKAQLNLPLTVQQTQSKISADVQPGTNLLVVTATDSSPTRARDIATTAASRLISVVRDLEPTPAGATTPPVTITVAQEAVTSRAPRNLARNLGFAAVLGLLLGAGGTALRESLYKTVSSERDLRRWAGLDMVGVIALGNEAGKGRRKPEGVLAEAFRTLRTRLPYPSGALGSAVTPVSLLVTSSVPREGTTAIACGLAIAMAETGSRVVLVDANLREPGVGTYLSLDATKGLADVLAGTAAVDDMLCDWGNGRLRILPAGYVVGDPGELLAAPALVQTMRTLEDRFDVVLVDAPPLLSSADAAVVSKLTTWTLLVVRSGRTRVEVVERAVAILHGVGARVVGGVLNALPKKLRGSSPWRRTAPAAQWRIPEQQGALLATAADEAGLFTDAGPAAMDLGATADAGGTDVDGTDAGGTDVGAARGRARVVAPAAPARGRARVIDAEGPETSADPDPNREPKS